MRGCEASKLAINTASGSTRQELGASCTLGVEFILCHPPVESWPSLDRVGLRAREMDLRVEGRAGQIEKQFFFDPHECQESGVKATQNEFDRRKSKTDSSVFIPISANCDRELFRPC